VSLSFHPAKVTKNCRPHNAAPVPGLVPVIGRGLPERTGSAGNSGIPSPFCLVQAFRNQSSKVDIERKSPRLRRSRRWRIHRCQDLTHRHGSTSQPACHRQEDRNHHRRFLGNRIRGGRPACEQGKTFSMFMDLYLLGGVRTILEPHTWMIKYCATADPAAVALAKFFLSLSCVHAPKP
jgi:hypothetical protein